MKHGNKVVFGLYDSRGEMETAIEKMRLEGFRREDISVLTPQAGEFATFGHEKATKAPEGAVTGGGVGAVLGGTLGWLVGAGVVIVNPVLAPLVAAGPIMAALAGASAGGVVGGLGGSLIGVGFPEYEAKRYEDFINRGGILLSIHADDAEWTVKAKRILEETGAHDISSSTEEGRPYPRPDVENKEWRPNDRI